MNIQSVQFPNVGFLKISLDENLVKPIKDEVIKIERDFLNTVPANKFLVGNIKKEFAITESISHIEKLIYPLIKDFDNSFNFLDSINLLSENRPMKINNVWVNFQEKYEFNPIHNHSGVFSFVIWIKIPFLMENEIQLSPGIDSKNPLPGHFSFCYTDSLGQICSYDIPADKNLENTMLLFPAKLLHSVYPFYSSDEYRISIAGNVVVQV